MSDKKSKLKLEQKKRFLVMVCENHTDTHGGYTLPFETYCIEAYNIIDAASKESNRARRDGLATHLTLAGDVCYVDLSKDNVPQWVLTIVPTDIPIRKRRKSASPFLGKMPC